jgi:iron(III) transport system ATP-binding protein
MSRVVIRDLHKHFTSRDLVVTVPRRGAINGLDLDIRDGEFFVLLGPSGCGKTTTLRCIAGLEEASAGTITLGDKLVADGTRAIFVPPNKRGVGMMFQSYALWPHMSVFQNVAYPLRHQRRDLSRRQVAEQVNATLAIVGLEGYEQRHPTQLSGGQQQRVALARALAARPGLLLFDEPLSNLDAQLRARLRLDLRRVHEETGGTSIYVTHDQAEALALADRVAIMKLGQLEQLGAPKDIFLSPASRFVAEFVGYENILPGTILAASGGVMGFRPDDFDGVLVGRAVPGARPGARGFAAIRASALRFSSSVGADSLGPAVVVGSIYQGDRYHIAAALGGGVLQGVLSLDGLAGAAPDHGATMHATVASTDVVILPEEAVEAAAVDTAMVA